MEEQGERFTVPVVQAVEEEPPAPVTAAVTRYVIGMAVEWRSLCCMTTVAWKTLAGLLTCAL
jgi:hypothetical protein